MTVSELCDRFSTIYMTTQVKKSTYDSYMVNINNHIKPAIGNYDVKDISFEIIDSLVDKMVNNGYSNTTIVYVLRNLTKAFNWGMKRGYIDKNIFASYDKPRKAVIEYSTLSYYETQKLLEYLYSNNNDIFFPVFLAVLYGLRRGECIGVRNNDISGNILSVRRTEVYKHGSFYSTDCKTAKSRRDIMLSDSTLSYIQYYNETRPANRDGYIFRDKLGERMTQNQLQLRFKDALSNCDLPNLRFHDLRHTYATLMLREGINPKVVSSVLGHADVGVTLDLYSHADVSMQKVCVDILDRNIKLN